MATSSASPSASRPAGPGNWVWFRLPLLVRRVFPSLSLTLIDGIYLAALGRLSALLPLLAFCIGFALSGFMLMPGQIFSASLFVVGALIAVSSLGAAVGLWLLGGYILGDLLILRLARVGEVSEKFGQQGWRDVACVLVLYTVLALLLVAVPAMSTRLRQVALLLPQQIWLAYTQNRPSLRDADSVGQKLATDSIWKKLSALGLKYQRVLMFPLDAALQAAFSGWLVYSWAQVTAIMLRSAFIWYEYPDVISTRVAVAFVDPLQYKYAPLLLVAYCAAVVRIGLEYLATGKEDFLFRVDELTEEISKRSPRSMGFLSWVSEFWRAAILVVLLFGVLMTPFYVITTVVVLLISILLRKAILPHVTAWANFIWAVPLIMRIFVAGALSYGLSLLMLGDNLNAADFYPVLRPLWLSLLLSSLLFPDEPRHTANALARSERKEPS